MGLILFILGSLLEIAVSTMYVAVVGLAATLAILVIAPLCVVAEIGLFIADLIRPYPPPVS